MLLHRFEQAISEELGNTWIGGTITVTFYISNLNEDFTIFVQHSIDLKLDTYYNTGLARNIKVKFTYAPENPNSAILPQLWSFRSSSLVYGFLVVSIIIGAAYIFTRNKQICSLN